MPDSAAALKALIFADDEELARAAFERLSQLSGPAVQALYAELLLHPDAWRRNEAALGLKRLADARAVPALLGAIFKPEHLGHNGTIVYALVSFDCADLLEELLLIVFYQGFEAAHMAHLALQRQQFRVTPAQQLSIRQHWQQVRLNPSPAVLSLGVDYLGEMLDELCPDN